MWTWIEWKGEWKASSLSFWAGTSIFFPCSDFRSSTLLGLRPSDSAIYTSSPLLLRHSALDWIIPLAFLVLLLAEGRSQPLYPYESIPMINLLIVSCFIEFIIDSYFIEFMFSFIPLLFHCQILFKIYYNLSPIPDTYGGYVSLLLLRYPLNLPQRAISWFWWRMWAQAGHWIRYFNPSFTIYVPIEWLYFSLPQFLHLSNKNNSNSLTALSWGRIQTRHLKWCLVQSMLLMWIITILYY